MTGTVKKAKSRNINMTAGSPVRLVVLFSIPLIFGNIFQQLYYITDAVIVGKYISIQALAAVNSCTWITWLLKRHCQGFFQYLKYSGFLQRRRRRSGKSKENRWKCRNHYAASFSVSSYFCGNEPGSFFSSV